MAPEVCMVRTAAAKTFGFSAKRAREPFFWCQLLDDFALLYGNQNKGYCHLVATMAILSFGAMYHYCDISRLK
jgi:hypothetical protein